MASTGILYYCTVQLYTTGCLILELLHPGSLGWLEGWYACSVQVYRTCYLTLVLPHPGSKQHEDDLLGGLGGGLAGLPADLAQGRPPAVPVTAARGRGSRPSRNKYWAKNEES